MVVRPIKEHHLLLHMHADVANEGKLSVPLTLVGDVFSGVLSDGQLRAMWTKASSLLSEKKIIKAPDSNPKTRWVASNT